MLALAIQHLVKTYDNGFQALKGIDISVEKGDFFALLGRNGAGKSTLIGILTSLIRKTSGKVHIFNHDIDRDFSKAKTCLGVVPQEFNMSIFDSVLNTLIYQAGYYGLRRKQAIAAIEYYLKKLELWGKRHTAVNKLSGGMKRRLMIARALIHQPRLLILDEPTAGVDIEIRHSMWEFLTQLNEQGTTIVLTTHYLEEAENLCRSIAVIDQGHVIAQSSMSDFLQKSSKEVFILQLESPYQTLPSIEGYTIYPHNPLTLEVEIFARRSFNFLLKALEKNNIIVLDIRHKTNRLEEQFLSLLTEE